MIVKQKLGSLKDFQINGREVEWIALEWFETSKRILHKVTNGGREVVIRNLDERQELSQDDVVYEDDSILIAIDIELCDAIVVHPSTMYAMAAICYEIGNKHLPLFFEAGAIVVPFEGPLFRLLSGLGYEPTQEKRKLLHPLRTTVDPHRHSGESLLSRILKLSPHE
jgi:urease accessory protein